MADPPATKPVEAPLLLCVDDDEYDGSLVERLLAPDHRVVLATSAKEGLRIARRILPACVLLDHHMPGQDGIDAIGGFLELDLPVILLTGHGDEEMAVAALKAGASDYLAKDRLTPNTLRRAVTHVLEKRALHSTLGRQAKQLEGLEAELFMFLNAVPVGIYVLDRFGVGYFANQTAVELLGPIQPGLEIAALAHLYPAYVVGTDELYPIEKLPIVRALAGETSTISDMEVARPDGRIRIAVTATPILGPTGEVEYAIAAFEDFTREATLAAGQHAAQQMEVVGQLAGGVAHDLNNLLTAILSFGGFARDALPAADPAQNDLKEVLQAADRASRLARGLLAFSRQHPVRPASTDLTELVRTVLLRMGERLGAHVRIETELADDLWQVRIDPHVFEQVVVNLVLNARDAMPHGGTLSLRTRNVTIQAATEGDVGWIEPGDYVELSVSDDGVGMDSATAAKVFEPFFTTKEWGHGQGTGLGLAMCYGSVQQSKGTIEVESMPGAGSTFRIHLPRHEVTSRPEVRQAKSTAGETILVVEADEQVRSIAQRALEREGYEVLLEGDPEAALQLFQAGAVPIDLVLADVVMPKLSGPELVAALRRLQPSLPVIYMSGHPRQALGPLGVSGEGVLHKPFSGEDLVSAIRERLGATSMARADQKFRELLTPESLDAFERSGDVTIGLWADGKIAYTNPRYARFATQNGGGTQFGDTWGIGRSVFDAISPPLRQFYQDAHHKTLESRQAWSHEYRCPTPRQQQRFRMRLVPLPFGRALVAVHTLFWVGPHPPSVSPNSAQFRKDGYVRQCASCRHVLRIDENQWCYVPKYIDRPPEKTTFGLCPTCALLFA